MSVQLRPEISWPQNDLLLPADLFGVTVPTGLADVHVRSPNYVDVIRMGQLGRDNAGISPTGQLSIVNGRVTKDLRVKFENPQTQWRRLGGHATHGPVQFKFTGGVVTLNLSIAIWILNTIEPDPYDDLSVQIFAAIYGHELLHVLDEIETVRWLSTQVLGQPDIQQYLVQAQPFTYGTSRQTTVEVEREFHEYIRQRIEGEVRHVWAPETNRKAGILDHPAQYKIVQEQVDTLRARQINRPRR
jgi:hypothetical protein